MGHHASRDVLEANRGLVTCLAETMRQPIQQMCRCQIAHDATPFSAHLVHVPIKQQQDVVDSDVFAPLIHDGDAIGIAVCRQAQVVAPLDHLCPQEAQRLQVRSGRAAAEERIVPLVDEGDPAARLR